ncbi:serine/threonine-protein kinase [Geothrix sp. 21YS21S-4]|uniref:serine/threonine-protein kinase n=1 Tax=Geothrix sp. 21YS21S-4 TaxID=3068889 RepID=UPI0027B9E74F|nr:serine/threonine-protein kinase [Geothrix sp. 21YS21S-4]
MGDLDHQNLPQAIGRYQVLRLLGSGAMGSVVLAEDPRIKRKVAIKLVRLDSVRTEADRHEYLLRFQREAEVSGLLNHPGIVAIYDVGEEEGLGPFLAMEFVPGHPLDELIKGAAPLPLKERLRIAIGIAEALDHAHAMGVVHRDVKPGNVMVADDGRTKLMDFGIAKREDASLTQTGTFLGTPSYASPEQIREGRVDSRSDIFSFGVLVFELMSGQSPFPGTSINTILYRIVNEPPVEVQPPVLGVLPDGWRRVFDRVLAKRPEERPPTCTAFIRDLVDAVVDLGKDDRHEILRLLKWTGEPRLPEITSPSADETVIMARPARRGLAPLWLGLGAAVLVAGGWFLFAPKGGRLRIDSLPAGAQVLVNGAPAGVTPLSQVLRPGDKVRLELKGHKPVDYAFRAGNAPAAFALQPVVSEELIDSTPSGATIVLDEKPLEGATPLKVRWNQAQAHRLTLTKGKLGAASDFGPGEVPGGRVFELKEATTAETRQEPALDPAAPGALKLSGSFSVRVKVDGKDLGEASPGSKLPLPPGTHKLELASPSHFYKDARTVGVSPGQVVSVALPALATLTVETFPGTGKVLVDGQDAGIESDGSSVQVTEGRHTVTVRGSRGSKSETVEVKGNKGLRFPL